MLSAVEFDSCGDFLATGDKGGRIVIFSRLTPQDQDVVDDDGDRDSEMRTRPPGSSAYQYMPYAEFQSHESEFDYLKSLEIEERINQIQWCQPTNNALFLLSTNDKTVKLWKVFNRNISYYEDVAEMEGDEDRYKTMPSLSQDPSSLVTVPDHVYKFPKKQHSESTVVANPRRIFSNAHNYHVNSISTNCDGETFMSADDLRINLWNLEVSDQCFSK